MLCVRVGENGDVDTAKAFERCGIKLPVTVLVLAAYHGRKKMVEYCITELRMDVDARDQYDRTAMHRAVQGGHLDIVE